MSGRLTQQSRIGGNGKGADRFGRDYEGFTLFCSAGVTRGENDWEKVEPACRWQKVGAVAGV